MWENQQLKVSQSFYVELEAIDFSFKSFYVGTFKVVLESVASLFLKMNSVRFHFINAKLKNQLDSNLEVFDFELSDNDMNLIDGLNLNERKLVPIITLNDGTKAPRDGKHIYYPYHEEF